VDELQKPILAEGLDPDTLKRLYESKRVYLANLRLRCFREINGSSSTGFTAADLEIIVNAIARTEEDIKSLILGQVKSTLDRCGSK
jgi:hypothetical protein